MIKLIYPKFWKKRNILACSLIPLSWIYRILGYLRSKLVNQIIFPGKVICIGNVTVGGTGKTQVAIWLAKALNKAEISFVIITKGYGSGLTSARIVSQTDTAKQVGDESILLRNFGTVIATPKIKEAQLIIKNIKPTLIIVDDGMQNPAFHKDINILTIDSARGIGNGFIFPAGPLRQSLEDGLKLADIVLMVGNKTQPNIKLLQKLANIELIPIPRLNQTNGFNSEPRGAYIEIGEHGDSSKNHLDHLKMGISISSKLVLDAKIILKNNIIADKKYLAFTAIGNPDKFYTSLAENNINVSMTRSFPDHHFFSQDEINALKLTAKENNLHLITTRKDYVKIKDQKDIECAEIDLIIKEGHKILELINAKIS